MSILDKTPEDVRREYEQWRNALRRRFWVLIASITSGWLAVGVFTVWLLRR